MQKLILTEIDHTNLPIFLNLAQAYEAEFSKLTGKKPNEEGKFILDTSPLEPYKGYLLYYEGIPGGFCVVNLKSVPQDVAEFYIVPVFRHKKFGTHLAVTVFANHPGLWQVRQIKGAEYATSFWRGVIKACTGNDYKEEVVADPDWGVVTQQIFLSKGKLMLNSCL